MLISWNVTRACNQKCLHCYRDAGAADANELDTDEGVALIGEIARAGFKVLVLSGGEPLLRQDIGTLIAAAGERGLRPVLGTNGTLLSRDVARKLKRAGLVRAGISLDDIAPRGHDSFRGDEGAWEKGRAAMRACKEEGLEFQIHTTVTRHNWKEIEQITDLAVSLGAKAHHVFFLVPTGRGCSIGEDAITPAQVEELLRRLLEKQRGLNIEIKPVCAPQFVRIAAEIGQPTRFTQGCLAGISYCCVLPGGDVHPCPYLPIKVGNVRETPFGQLWQQDPNFQKLRSQRYSGRCGGCIHRVSCGGCRARAWATSGDYMEEDDGCIFSQRGTRADLRNGGEGDGA